MGWAWNPATQQIDLAYYGYIQKQRTSVKLASVPLNTWVDCEIRLWRGGQTVTINGNSHTENHSLGLSGWLPTMTWVLMTAYFGGDETAPHDIDVEVQGAREL